jgi:hypothetical protein
MAMVGSGVKLSGKLVVSGGGNSVELKQKIFLHIDREDKIDGRISKLTQT